MEGSQGLPSGRSGSLDYIDAQVRCSCRITGDTLVGMNNDASVRDLRNHGGEIIERARRGERITVTRDGEPVAELTPLPRQRLSAAVLIERFGRLPSVDPGQFRADIDGVIDQSL